MDIETLQTERLLIRPANTEDASFMLELLNSPGWIKYIGDRNITNIDLAKTYIHERLIRSYQQHGHGLMVVEDHSKNPLGLCGLLKRSYLEAPDLGFAILPQHEGQGYMYESSKAIIQEGINKLGLKKVYATTLKSNQRSQQLLQKLGFKYIEDTKTGSSQDEVQLFALEPGFIRIP
jgi:RimJ/RimL family protein N-acetyltransferase